MDTVKMLAPYTIMCHIKDVGLDMYEDGFLLSEVVMGEAYSISNRSCKRCGSRTRTCPSTSKW